jgi:hypothetical protein
MSTDQDNYARRRDHLLKMIRSTQWMWDQQEPARPVRKVVVKKKKVRSDEAGG